jgi:Uma2 family endonuclease
VAFDRDVKIPLYAAHQIPESWIVDAQSYTLSIFRAPGSHGYEQTTNLKAGDSISPLALPHHAFRMDAIVPSH